MSDSYPCKECLFIITCTRLCSYARNSIKQENIKLSNKKNRCLLCGSSMNLKTGMAEAGDTYDYVEVLSCNMCGFSRKNCFKEKSDKSKYLVGNIFTKAIILGLKPNNEKE